jgi:hypothetical protein
VKYFEAFLIGGNNRQFASGEGIKWISIPFRDCSSYNAVKLLLICFFIWRMMLD